MSNNEPKIVASVGGAEMIANPITAGEGRSNIDHVQYRIDEQIVQRDTYFAYVLTQIAGAMTESLQTKTIGKPITDKSEEE